MAREPIPTWYFVLVVVRREDRFLVIQEKKYAPLWYLPAGRVEPYEDFLSAARRETLEESGLQVRIERLVRVEHTPMAGGKARVRAVLTAVAVDDTEIKQRPDRESLGAAWVTLEELDRLPLRSEEVRELFNYLASGGQTHPLSVLSVEGTPYGEPP